MNNTTYSIVMIELLFLRDYGSKVTNSWLETFQSYISDVIDLKHLQFTVEIRRLLSKITTNKKMNEKVNIVNQENFAFLDMEMYWNLVGKLNCCVYMKESQWLRYLKKVS